MTRQRLVGLGYISGIYGVRGWVRVYSFTQPREQILNYTHWLLSPDKTTPAAAERRVDLESGRQHGKGIVAKLAGVDDRDQASELINQGIFIARDDLPETTADEYYWADLVGCEVRNLAGDLLGMVDHLLETGAHDVLVLSADPAHMIPFVMDSVVKRVDLDARIICVDWHAQWWD